MTKAAYALLGQQCNVRLLLRAPHLNAEFVAYRQIGAKRVELVRREHGFHSHQRPSFITASTKGQPLSSKLLQRTRGLDHVGRGISSIGAEPGIDTTFRNARSERRAAVLNTDSADVETDIKVIDYSDQRIVEHEVTHASLDSFLTDQAKPDWAACRWIYVNGINWDVVKCLGNHKSLHRLAIEDVLDTGGSAPPAKADWYDGHCYIELSLQKLVRLSSPMSQQSETFRSLDEGTSQSQLKNEKPETAHPKAPHRTTWRTLSPHRSGMTVEQVSIFLTTDNTVITIFEHSGAEILAPIWTRLQSAQTILRSSNDPSMLVHAVIDTVVDLSLPIAKAVSEAFGELETAVLTKPAIEQSKQLYVLRSGLTLLMDNIVSTGGLVKLLIDHRTSPAQPTTHAPGQSTGATPSPQPTVPINTVHISPLTQVYLQDIQDHIRTISNSTHMSIRSAENLTALIFNTIAASQNESVRQLTLVSCFFLPLTFLTGYFGMNFDPMPIVNQNSDTMFWMIATPVMAVTVGLLLARRGRRAKRYRGS